MQHIVIDPRGALPTAVQAFVVPDDPGAIALAIESMIARLDELGGDPDLELTGDETDFDGTDQGDVACVEWHSLSRKERRQERLITLGEEDDEEDDGIGDCTDDEPGFDHRSRRLTNGYGFGGAGCGISDPGGGNVTDDPHDQNY